MTPYGPIPELIYTILNFSIPILFFFEATILFLRSKSNKGRKTLAIILIIWGILYLLNFLNTIQHPYLALRSLLSIEDLFLGYLFITMTFLYPLQVIIPGWLSLKRLIRLFIPFIILLGFYLLILRILNQNPMDIVTYEELLLTLPSFNVWFRLVILSSNAIYMIIIIRWLCKYEKHYLQWSLDNFSNQEKRDISWMKTYNMMASLNFTLYVIMILNFSVLTVLLLIVTTAISLSFLFYKALFTESAYPEDFFDSNMVNTNHDVQIGILPDHASDQITSHGRLSFEVQMKEHLETLKQWMDTEKPYLYKDFKLNDVSRILPLNRSYLSRIFNEGYGKNFNEVVRSYRIEYSILLMGNHPELPLYQISELCGFSSSSSYITAFKMEKGITPLQFKSRLG